MHIRFSPAHRSAALWSADLFLYWFWCDWEPWILLLSAVTVGHGTPSHTPEPAVRRAVLLRCTGQRLAAVELVVMLPFLGICRVGTCTFSPSLQTPSEGLPTDSIAMRSEWATYKPGDNS